MCREILNSCVRNTEEAERASKAQAGGVAGATSTSGRGLRKGIWGMIEESELAKSIRLKEEKKVRCCLAFCDSFFIYLLTRLGIERNRCCGSRLGMCDGVEQQPHA